MRPVTIAIGAGLDPSGPGLWSQAEDQTGVGEERAWVDRRRAINPLYWDPELHDKSNYGRNYREYLWGKVRVIMTNGDPGLLGGVAELLGGAGNATTFSSNLIVFTRSLDLNSTVDRRWLLHELRHVMQAQALGAYYLDQYVKLWRPWQSHDDHPMERDAIDFSFKGIP